MRKQELVHLHALCVLVRDHADSRTDVPDGAFAGYDELDVSPTAIYRDKATHRRAVLELSDDVVSVIADDPPGSDPEVAGCSAPGDTDEAS